MPKNLNGQQSSGNTDWETPSLLMTVLKMEFGEFDLDPCATYENSKARKHIGPDCDGLSVIDGKVIHSRDGLEHSWRQKVFCNPPYGRQTKHWAEKCYLEVERGNAELVVALLPVSTGTDWWQTWVAKATEVRFLKGRVSFIRPGKPLGPATFDSAIVVFRRGQLGWGRYTYWDYRKEKKE